MKTHYKATYLSLTCLLLCQLAFAQQALDYGFFHPQDTARTKVWWFHGETSATRESITADLEAFKQQGVGGVVYYDQVHGKGEGAFSVFSPEWWDELIFSSQEARRLGLGFETNCGNGYVAGGKWITPDKSMQSLVCTEMVVDGGRDLAIKLELPEKMPGGWYSDVAVLAVPYEEDLLAQKAMPQMQLSLDKGFTARSITYEAGAQGKARTSSMQVPPTHFTLNPDLPDADTHQFFGCGFTLLPPVGELQSSDDGISYKKVCDLRPRYRNMGGIRSQTVSFPAVKARHFRIVMADSAVKLSHVTLSARAAVDAWQEKASLISEFMEANRTPRYGKEDLADFSKATNLTSQLGADGVLRWGKAPKGKWLILRFLSVSNGGHTKHGRAEALGLECDKLSVEGARAQWENYIKPVVDSIRAHQGALDGICMDSHEAGPQNWTVGFEAEFKQLRGYDIIKYLPVMAGFVVNSAEESDAFLYDLRHTINDLISKCYFGEMNSLCHSAGLTLTAQAIGGAHCMAGDAISVKRFIDKPQGEFWAYQTEGNYDIKDCSSSAHLYGKHIASGEAFTDATYKHSLSYIKNLYDYALAYGINEFVVCAVAYQPWLRKDGEPLRINTANGRQYVLNRLNTLWPLSRPFWDYQARSTWLMRQGKPVADICIYLGDEIPMRTLSHKLPVIPQGYYFDTCTTDALIHRMTAKDGRIVLPDGISYRILILPPDGKLTEEASKQIAYLRSQGIPVYDPQTDSRTLEEALRDYGILPDVETGKAQQLYFAHRRTSGNDIYFLNNHSDEPINAPFTFRTPATTGELWDAVTGKKTPLPISSVDGRTVTQLSIGPRESYFIILHNSPQTIHSGREKREQNASRHTISHFNDNWHVTFDPQMGGPAETVHIDTLSDWSKNANARIRYYSGVATYHKTISCKKAKKNSECHLRLALPNSAAEVYINGTYAGTIWCAPYDLDITPYMKKGNNDIEIHVANCLWNRLVGDALLKEPNRITWQTTPLAKPTDPLIASGLTGVSILKIEK